MLGWNGSSRAYPQPSLPSLIPGSPGALVGTSCPLSSRGEGGGQVGRLPVWDPITSDLRLSVALVLKDGNFVIQNRTLWDSLVEWTMLA